MPGTGQRNRYHKRDRKVYNRHYNSLHRQQAGTKTDGIGAQHSKYPS